MLIEYPGGTIVSGVIDKIRVKYDYIGIDEPPYRKHEYCILHVQNVIQEGREEIGPGRLLTLNGREKPKRIMDGKRNILWRDKGN